MKMFRNILVATIALSVLSGCGSPEMTKNELRENEALVNPNALSDDAEAQDEAASSEDTSANSAVTGNAETSAKDTSAESEAQTSAHYVPEKEPETDGETRLTFLAAGDNIIHGNVYLDAENRAKNGEKYNFTDMYDGIADAVKAADIAFINQETPICGDSLGIYGYPNFNSPEAVGDTLIELGFDIVNVANNHTLDMKERGYRGTLDYWDARSDEITMIGGYRSKADYENIRVIEKDGISIALLSYTYGTNGMFLPVSSELMIPSMDSRDKDCITKDEIVRMVKKADGLADLVFVVMHWGEENYFTLSSSQKTLSTAITEAGADVIIGMHPHVIQDMEWKTASDGSETLVIYSLGNLINTQYDNQNLVGGIVTFDIVKDKNGNITIEDPVYNPTVTHYNKDRLGLQVYFMQDYTEELVKLHGNPSYGTTAAKKIWTMEKIRSFATDNVSEEFLPDFLK